MITRVELSPLALKQIRKLPASVVTKLQLWKASVERDGLEQTRKRPGFHDEPLQGERRGQRSIRLNRAYRAFYKVIGGTVQIAWVIEVNKHEY